MTTHRRRPNPICLYTGDCPMQKRSAKYTYIRCTNPDTCNQQGPINVGNHTLDEVRRTRFAVQSLTLWNPHCAAYLGCQP